MPVYDVVAQETSQRHPSLNIARAMYIRASKSTAATSSKQFKPANPTARIYASGLARASALTRIRLPVGSEPVVIGTALSRSAGWGFVSQLIRCRGVTVW